jgi:hypothetical protein
MDTLVRSAAPAPPFSASISAHTRFAPDSPSQIAWSWVLCTVLLCLLVVGRLTLLNSPVGGHGRALPAAPAVSASLPPDSLTPPRPVSQI